MVARPLRGLRGPSARPLPARRRRRGHRPAVQALKVLHVLHNHPVNSPGGTEAYTLRVFEALRRTEGWQPLLVAREPASETSPVGEFRQLPGTEGQYLVATEEDRYDKLFMTEPEKSIYTQRWTEFLEAHRPDVVHFQHT